MSTKTPPAPKTPPPATPPPATPPSGSTNNEPPPAITPKSGCPKPPTLDQTADDISKMLNAQGASQKCKDLYSHATSAGLTTDDAAAVVVGMGFGGGATNNYTASQNKLKESMDKEGCADVYSNISQQLNSQQSVLCQLNNTSNSTNVSGSAGATISIIQKPPTKEQVDLRKAILAAMIKPVYIPPAPDAPDVAYTVASQTYNDARIAYQRTIDDITGVVNITDSSFKLKAGVELKALTNTKSMNTTKLADTFKAVAHAKAASDIKNKSGVGSNSDQIKSLIDNKIKNQNQTITNSIKNSISNCTMGGSSSTGFVLIVTGALNMNKDMMDEYAQTRMITSSIMTSATNMGSTIASDILSSSQNSDKSTEDSSGDAALLKQIYQGQQDLVKQNTKGVTGFLSGITSMFSMALLLPLIIGAGVIFLAPHLVEDFLPGPLKYVVGVILIYLIVAWFMSWWPFSSSENKLMYEKAFVASNFNSMTGNEEKYNDVVHDTGYWGDVPGFVYHN